MTQTTETSTLSKPAVSRPDVLWAAYLLGQHHNISEIARLLGKGPTVLANKLNHECDSHHLNLGEAVAVTEITGDNRILEAWAASQGWRAPTKQEIANHLIELDEVALSPQGVVALKQAHAALLTALGITS